MLINILFFTFIGSVFSLIGGVILLIKKELSQEFTTKLISFAAGVLLTSAFFDLLPEAIKNAKTIDYFFIPVFMAIVLFFFLERSFFWFHHHHNDECHHHKIKALVYLISLGDSVHNFIDGVAIAASFMISFPLGVATSLAVAAHEIPQEIADFSIMLASGVSKKRVVYFNLLSALTAFLGAIITYSFYSVIKNYLWIVVAFTGGMFIYIATADLIPELHKAYNKQKGFSQMIYFILGIIITLLFTYFINPKI